MAILRSGIFGPVSGKIGGVVGASWKRINYIRSMPVKKKKNQGRSPAQLANQYKFKYLHEWLVPFYPFVTIGFRNEAKNKTEINAAFSANYRHALIGNSPDLQIDYAKVQLSTGNLPQLNDVAMRLLDRETIHVSWLQNYQNAGVFNDQVMLVVYSPELKIVDGITGGAKRADKELDFKFNPKLKDVSLEVYISVVSLNGKAVSASSYLGRLAPL